MADLVGQQFGNYRLLSLLGRGGFAEVYLGQHVYLTTQQAALKILSTHLDSQDTQAFIREAETIATLVHPHIVRVLDFDIQERCPFLVMEYAPHGSLRQRHARGEQVPLSVVVSYVQQIAQGLAYAHEKKTVHRDVKPDNMLINRYNKILISDFGIATIAHNTSSQIAQAIFGTISYMAPEQFQGQFQSASDQYALAVTIYEWLTGTYPFTGNFAEMAFKHTTSAPPSLREKCPTLPPQVEQVIFTALAKNPADRFADVLVFANALTQASQMASHEMTFPGQAISSFPPSYPAQSSAQIAANVLIATSTPPQSPIEAYRGPTDVYMQPVQHLPLPLDKRKKRRKSPIVMLILALLVVFTLVLASGSIFAVLKNVSKYSQAPAPVTPTATTAPHFTSVADFTTQSPQLSNMKLLRNDSSFQDNHSVIDGNGQVVIAFPAHANMKTVTIVIRGLISQSSPNQSGFAPINLLCNGQVIVSNYIMPGNGFAPDTTSIQIPGGDLASGTNQIELQVTQDAQTLFWLYRLEVQQDA